MASRSQGRSRFSKALPPPPTLLTLQLDTSSFGMPLNEICVSTISLSPTATHPPPATQTSQDCSKSVNPLHRLATSENKSIPRKPVGGHPNLPMPNHKAQPMPHPSRGLKSDLGSDRDGGPYSPAFSFSSLLSAYTGAPPDSTARPGSGDGGGAKTTRILCSSGSVEPDGISVDREPALTVNQPPTTFPPRTESISKQPSNLKQLSVPNDKFLPTAATRYDSLKFASSSQGVPTEQPNQEPAQPPTQATTLPTISEHAGHVQNPGDAAASPVQPPTSSLPGLNRQSSNTVRPELWKRRSTKTDNNLVVPELRLETSNGSTALPIHNSAPAPETQMRRFISALPPQTSHTLPGRNIGTFVTEPSQASPLQSPTPVYVRTSEETMGQCSSHVQKKNQGPIDHAADLKKPIPSPNKPIPSKMPVPVHPPTPEYQKNDVRTPVLETILSPLSPASSPEPTQDAPSPSSQESRHGAVRINSPPLRPAGGVETTEQSTIPSVALYKEDLDRLNSDDSQGSGLHQVQPQERTETAPIRDRRKQEQDETRHLTLGSTPHAEKSPVSNVYKGIAEDRERVIEATPLTVVHYRCYKQHRHFRQSPNLNCPLACQTCHRKDSEMRWRCNWCALRICRTCMDMLVASNRNVDVLLEKIACVKQQIVSLEGEDAIENSILPGDNAESNLPGTPTPTETMSANGSK